MIAGTEREQVDELTRELVKAKAELRELKAERETRQKENDCAIAKLADKLLETTLVLTKVNAELHDTKTELDQACADCRQMIFELDAAKEKERKLKEVLADLIIEKGWN